MGKFKHIYSGIKETIKDEGIISLISRGFVFLSRRVILLKNYYVILTKLEDFPDDNEAEFLPVTDNYCSHIITTNREADELVAKGFELAAYELDLRASLDKHAVVFCIFIGKELASFVSIADNMQGKATVEPCPFAVDFDNGEIVTGRALTVPKFRRLHLRLYSGLLLRKFCREKGIRLIKGTLGANNYASMAAMAQVNKQIAVSKCRFIKILRFTHLKEKKMEPTKIKEIFEQVYPNNKDKQKKE